MKLLSSTHSDDDCYSPLSLFSHFINLITIPQIEFNKQCEVAWAALIPSIEGVVVEDPEYVRSKVQEQSAADSLTPPHNFTVGRKNSSSAAAPTAPSTSPSSGGFGFGGSASSSNNSNTTTSSNNKHENYDSSPSFPPPPSVPPPSTPAPSSPPTSSNPFGGEYSRSSDGGNGAGAIQGVRQQSSAFTDEEGPGGDDDDEIEEV